MIVKVEVIAENNKHYFVYHALLLSAQLEAVNKQLKNPNDYKVGQIIKVKI